MELNRMLYSILKMVIVKNKFDVKDYIKESIVFGEKVIAMEKNIRISELHKEPSAYINYVPLETLSNFAPVSNKMKVLLYLYLRIIENHRINKENGIIDYSMNVKCSMAEIASNTGLSRKTVYNLVEDLSKVHENQEFPILFEEKDGSISLSYLYCPFKNINDVLYHEEMRARKYFETHGTEDERMMWKNMFVMEDMKCIDLESFSDVAEGNFENGLSNKRWIFGYIYDIVKNEKDPFNYDFHIDYKELITWIRRRSRKVPSESYLRKSVKIMEEAKIIMISSRSARGKLLYKLNRSKVKI